MKSNLFRKGAFGLHIIGEICTKNNKNLLFAKQTETFILKTIKRDGLHALGLLSHKFSNGGFSAIVNLAESHLALHTWPELNYLTIDIYTCNYTRNNNKSCRTIFETLVKFFNPSRIKKRVLRR